MIAPLTAPEVAGLLTTALSDYDPRKIAQALDQTRDADLIKLKGYEAMSKPTVYTCIDDTCYEPAHDSGAIKKAIKQALDAMLTKNQTNPKE